MHKKSAHWFSDTASGPETTASRDLDALILRHILNLLNQKLRMETIKPFNKHTRF